MSNTATQNPIANVSHNVDTDFSRRRPGRHKQHKELKTSPDSQIDLTIRRRGPQKPIANVSNNVDTDFSRQRPGRHNQHKDVKTSKPCGRPRLYEDVSSKYQIIYTNRNNSITPFRTVSIITYTCTFII